MNTRATCTETITFDGETCSRCGGLGVIPSFGHVLHGQCFKCQGSKRMLTPAGRSAYALYIELLSAAAAFKQAWQVEVGDRVELRRGQYSTITGKDFCSRTGSVVDGRCEGSALLIVETTSGVVRHAYPLDASVKVEPTDAQLQSIRAEVKRRRKGAC